MDMGNVAAFPTTPPKGLLKDQPSNVNRTILDLAKTAHEEALQLADELEEVIDALEENDLTFDYDIIQTANNVHSDVVSLVESIKAAKA
jgi:hypothetical protein